ncbi:ATP-binding protein [Thermodesulfobacteriota bacterium]
MKISTKLTFVFLVMVFALLVSNLLSYHSERRALFDQVMHHLESVASIQQARIESITEQNYERFRLVASRTQLRISFKQYLAGGDGNHLAKIQRILNDAKGSIASFSRIDVLNLDGSIVGSTTEEAIGSRSTHVEEVFFQQGRQGKTGTQFSRNPDGTITQHFAGPLILEGEILGVMIIDSDVESIMKAIQDYSGLGESGETILARQTVDGDALFLMPTRFDPQAGLQRSIPVKADNVAIIQSFKEENKFLTDVIDYRGEPILAVTHFIDTTGWGLVVKIDAAEAFAPVRQLKNTLLLIISSCILLIVAIFFYLIQAITRPITRLTTVAGAIAQGDQVEIPSSTSPDEIGLLGQAFRTMTRQLMGANVELEQKLSELQKEIAERKKAEEALKLNEERLESLLSIHTLKKMSEQELCSYALEECVKITHSEVGYLHFVDEDEQTIALNFWSKETLKNCTAAKTPHYPVASAGIWADSIRLREYVIHNDYPSLQDKKGYPAGHFPVSRHLGVPIFENERIVAVVGVGNKAQPYDKFDARQLSLFFNTTWDMLKKSRAEAEKESLTNQLNQAQKMESIGTLAGGIAHDFNNILAAVIGFTELAQTAAAGQKQMTEYLAEIFNAGNRAKELVRQILTFSRQTTHELKPLQIHLVAKEAMKLLRSSIPSTIEIRENIDAQAGTVLADPTQIHQVLMNLCANAYQAMRETGGLLVVELNRIDIDADDEKVAGLHLATGSYVRLTVSDDGVGIDRSKLEKIFEPYYTTKQKGEGTGLGLALVHGIVKSHGGYISVYSEPGKGTTFQVYLPRVITDVDGATERIDRHQIPTGDERILIVDDEEIIVKMEEKMLVSLGYQVNCSTKPEQALETFAAHPENFDLIITDMTMPGMTGAELSQRILAVRPDTPVIMCTGFSELINKDKAESIGIREFIMKPVVRKELAAVVRRVLDGT